MSECGLHAIEMTSDTTFDKPNEVARLSEDAAERAAECADGCMEGNSNMRDGPITEYKDEWAKCIV